MGYPTCDICNQFSDNINHICNNDDILHRINCLEKRARDAESKLDRINDAALKVFASLPKQLVDIKYLEELWRAVECCFDSPTETLQSFHGEWMVTQRVLCEAFDVFRNINHYPTALEKLTILFGACLEAAEVCGYDRKSLDMTPEQVLAER